MRTNKKKAMGRRMLTAGERAAGTPYERSAAWARRKANIKNRVAYNIAVPKEQRVKNRKANLARNRSESRARALERRKNYK